MKIIKTFLLIISLLLPQQASAKELDKKDIIMLTACAIACCWIYNNTSNRSVNLGRITQEEYTINHSGNGNLKGEMDVKRLIVNLSGNGTITLTGKAELQELNLSGNGNYNSEQIESDTIVINSSGNVNAYLSSKRSITGQISGSGNVFYQGNPSITIEASGSGNVKKRRNFLPKVFQHLT